MEEVLMAIIDGYSRPVPIGGRPIPFSPVDQSTTTEGLPVAKPTTTEGLPVAKPTTTEGLPVAKPTPELKPGKPDIGIDPNYTPPPTSGYVTQDETPQGQPQDNSTVPAEEVRGQAQDRPWRESDWAMMILGGIALYWVGRKVVPSIRGG